VIAWTIFLPLALAWWLLRVGARLTRFMVVVGLTRLARLVLVALVGLVVLAVAAGGAYRKSRIGVDVG
jgi:hypothetical protein